MNQELGSIQSILPPISFEHATISVDLCFCNGPHRLAGPSSRLMLYGYGQDEDATAMFLSSLSRGVHL